MPSQPGQNQLCTGYKINSVTIPIVREILPAVTQFIEQYFSEMYTKLEINKDSVAETDM